MSMNVDMVIDMYITTGEKIIRETMGGKDFDEGENGLVADCILSAVKKK